jgi:hypothetical protein
MTGAAKRKQGYVDRQTPKRSRWRSDGFGGPEPVVPIPHTANGSSVDFLHARLLVNRL